MYPTGLSIVAGFEAVLAMVLAAVFLAGAMPKLRNPRRFHLTVLEYRVLTPSAAKAYARVVPSLELVVGCFLVVGTIVWIAALLASVLLTTFLVGIVVNLTRGRHIDCGCFAGKGQRQLSWLLVFEDSVLLISALVLLIATRPDRELEWWSVLQPAQALFTTHSAVLGMAVIVLIGVFLVPVWRSRTRNFSPSSSIHPEVLPRPPWRT